LCYEKKACGSLEEAAGAAESARTIEVVRPIIDIKAGKGGNITGPSCRKRSVNEMQEIPVIDVIATGQNIARLRTVAGLSVKDLQEILGFANPQAIYKWQNGQCMPSLDNMVILASALRVRIDDIIVFQTVSMVSVA